MADLTGNTLSTAYNLGTLGKPAVYSDWVGGVDSADWYKFTLAQTSSLRATLNGLTGKANLALYDSNGVALSVIRDSTGTTPRAMDLPLASGDYYIEVTPASASGNGLLSSLNLDDAFYSLNIGADVIADNAGNTLATARSQSFGSAPIMYDDWVGIADSKDLYKVTLSSRSSLQATLYGLTQSVSFQVLDSLGNVLPKFSTFSGKSFDIELDIGTYYVQVAIPTDASAFYGEKYSLSLFNTAVRGGSQENDGAGRFNDPVGDRSRLITLTDTPQVINDWVGSGVDNYDDYSFTLTNPSFIRATLNGRSDSVFLDLLNSKGNSIISRETTYSNVPLVIDDYLDAGKYFIRVRPYYRETAYSLNISAPIIPDQAGRASFSGDTFADQSKAITLANNVPQVINDWVGYTVDDYDDYSFTLTNTSFVRASLNGRTDNASLFLLDSEGRYIVTENGGFYRDTPLALDTALAAGKYVIRVMSAYISSYYYSQTAYSLNISALTIPDQAGKAAFVGDTLVDQSKPITLTSTPQVINDWIGYGDDGYDDYSFTLTDTSSIRATLNGGGDGISLFLFDSKGNAISGENYSYNDNPLVRDTALTAGKYIIRVVTRYGKTPYSLNISASIISDQAGRAAFAGDTFADQSKAITLANTPQVINDWIGEGVDDYDDYSFTLTNASFIRANLNGRSGNASLLLLNNKGNTILSKNAWYDNTPLALDTSLAAGKYVIRVKSYSSGKTAYSLNVSSSIGIPTFIERSDDTLITSTTILTGVVPIVINDRVGNADMSDFYRIQLDKASFLRATLNGNGANDYTLYQILDKDGQLFKDGSFKTGEFSLQAGIYYLKVNLLPTYVSTANYSFNVSSIEINDIAGSDLGAAKELTIGTTPLSSSEWVGGADPVDFYKFNLKEASFFQATLYGLTGKAKFYLVDQDGKNLIGYSTNFGTSSENLYLPLAAGTYYLNIYSYTTDQKSFSDSFYNLVTSAKPIGDLVGVNTSIPITTPINQFRAEYFNNIDPNIGTAVLVRNESSIDYNWGAGSPAAGVNADNFSVRWTGKFKFEEAGVYLFRNRADDGIRTWVDGQLIIDEWKDRGATDYGAYLNMTAGEHDIKVEYYDRGADAVAKVLWEKGGLWTGIYFDKQDLTGRLTSSESFSTTTPSFSKDWGIGGPKDTPTDRFSALFDTTRWLPAGFYKIETKADDGIRVKINYKTVIDRWLINGQSQDSGFFQWAGGDVPIRVEYFENEGSAALSFNIKRVEKFSDQVQPNRWNATVFAWDPSQGDTPSVDFASGDFNNPNVIGITDLGSNVLSNSKKGFYGDWGSGALNKDGARLPNDYFAVRAYTIAEFTGNTYKFQAKGDEGFQLFAKDRNTGKWFYITNKDSWQTGEINQEFVLPKGTYDLHFQLYEKTGNSNFDLSWEEIQLVSVKATDSKAAETWVGAAKDSGTFTIIREGGTATALEVEYVLTGTARQGIDYRDLNNPNGEKDKTGKITIPIGQSSAFVTIDIIDDIIAESVEKIKLEVKFSNNYQLPNQDKLVDNLIEIADNEHQKILFSESDNENIDALLGRNGQLLPNQKLNRWDIDPNTRTISYSFYKQGAWEYEPDPKPKPDPKNNYSELSLDVQNQVEKVLKNISQYINVNFKKVEEDYESCGTLRYSQADKNKFHLAFTPEQNEVEPSGDVFMKPYGFLEKVDPGAYYYHALVHETLHALGLKHTGNYNAENKDKSEKAASGPFLTAGKDNVDNTIMTYNFGEAANITPMPYDIQALQHLYGARIISGETPTNYSYSKDDISKYRQTLWDPRKGVSLDLSKLHGGPFDIDRYRIDLKEGGIISKIADYNAMTYFDSSKKEPGPFTATQFGLSIAYGTIIKNLVTSRCDDIVISNKESHVFSGYIRGKSCGNDEYIDTNSGDVLDLSSYDVDSITSGSIGNDLYLTIKKDLFDIGNSSITLKNYIGSTSLMRIKVGNQYYRYIKDGFYIAPSA